jgi:GH35 family endo-1,4-beta-xylanase
MEDISSKMFYQHHFIYGRFIEDVSAKAFNQRMSHRIHLIKGRFIEDVQSTDVTSTTLHRRTFHRRRYWTFHFIEPDVLPTLRECQR